MELVNNFKVEGKATPVLIEQFTNLDNKTQRSMIAAANAEEIESHHETRVQTNNVHINTK